MDAEPGTPSPQAPRGTVQVSAPRRGRSFSLTNVPPSSARIGRVPRGRSGGGLAPLDRPSRRTWTYFTARPHVSAVRRRRTEARASETRLGGPWEFPGNHEDASKTLCVSVSGTRSAAEPTRASAGEKAPCLPQWHARISVQASENIHALEHRQLKSRQVPQVQDKSPPTQPRHCPTSSVKKWTRARAGGCDAGKHDGPWFFCPVGTDIAPGWDSRKTVRRFLLRAPYVLGHVC